MSASTPSSASDLFDQRLAELLQRMEHAENPDQVLAEFCQQNPSREEEARRRARFARAVDRSKPDPFEEHPKQLGDFRIIRRMAIGGMGVIYEAVQERLKRRVVLKTMRAGLAEGPGRIRFLREQEALARLHQTHIVPIHTADEEGGLQYFVMPYIEGASLNHIVTVARDSGSTAGPSSTSLSGMAARWLERSEKKRDAPSDDNPTTPAQPESNEKPPRPRTLPMSYFRSVAQAIADVAEGLHHAHQTGLLHRDVKPSNLMIEPNGKCWIIDFGLAALVQGSEPELLTASRREETCLTIGDGVGTPAYMAPEQWDKNSKLDARTDVWGLGATLYELLTLHRPIVAAPNALNMTQREQVHSRIGQAPPSPSQYVRNLPEDLEAICLKALERDPESRYGSALEMAEDLKRWLRREPTRALPGRVRTVRLWARRNTGWAMALTLLTVGTAVLVIGQGVQNIQKEEALQELQRQRQREKVILKQQQSRLGIRELGWSNTAWTALQTAPRLKHDPTLRNHLTATLEGMDAEVIRHFKQGASSVAYDPRGNRVLIGGLAADDSLPGVRTKLWDGTASPPEPVGPALPGAVAFAPNGTPLQAALKNPWSVELWDLGARKVRHTFQVEPGRQVPFIEEEFTPQVCLSEDGRYLALTTLRSTGEGVFVVWEGDSGKQLFEYRGIVHSIAFTPPGGPAVVAAGMADGQVRFWKLPEGEEAGMLNVSTHRVTALAIGHDPLRVEKPVPGPLAGWLLAIGTKGAEVAVWRPAGRERLQRFQGSSHDIYVLALSPDGATLGSGGRGVLRLWDVATGRVLLRCLDRTESDIHVDCLSALAFSPDGRELMFANRASDDRGAKRRVTMVRLLNGRGVTALRGLGSTVQELRLAPTGRLVAGLSQGWQVGIWDYGTGRLQHVLTVPEGYYTDNAGIAFSQDGTQFAYSAGTQARLWDLRTGRLMRKWELPPGLEDRLAFSPDGMLWSSRCETLDAKQPPVSEVPAINHPRVVRVRKLLSGQSEKPLEFKTCNLYVGHCDISSDGQFLAVRGLGGTAADSDHRFDLYDLSRGTHVWGTKPPFPNPNAGPSFSFDPSGRTLTLRVEPNGKALMILSLKEFKPLRVLPVEYAAVHPRLSYYLTSWGPDVNKQAHEAYGVGVYLMDNSEAVVRLGIDHELCSAIRFSPTGNEVMWGTTTGELLVADLAEVNRWLTKVGLGW